MGDIADMYSDMYDYDLDPEPARCHYCGRPIGFEEVSPGRWRPTNSRGEPHSCKARGKSLRKQAAHDFDDED